MTTDPTMHTPSPAFVAALEHEIVAAVREPRFSRRRERIAAGLILALGLVLGAGTQIASAQVQAALERGERERTTAITREVAAMRLQLAYDAHARAQREFDAGKISRQSLLEAAAEQRAAEVMILVIDSEIAEVRATSTAPRDELWAPLVDGQDFVTKRLQLNAVVAQQRLAALEATLADADRRARAGVLTVGGLTELQRAEVQARAEFEFVAQRVRLREQFLKEKLTPEEVSRREVEIQLVTDVMRANRLFELAQTQLKLTQERHAAGIGVLLDVKRAELAVLERQEEMRALQVRRQQATLQATIKAKTKPDSL